MIGGARRGDDMRPAMFGELDSDARDAARSTLDQDRLARFQLQRFFDRADGSQSGESHRGRLLMRDAVRLTAHDARLQRDLLCVTALHALHRDSEDIITQAVSCNTGTYSHDRA